MTKTLEMNTYVILLYEIAELTGFEFWSLYFI